MKIKLVVLGFNLVFLTHLYSAFQEYTGSARVLGLGGTYIAISDDSDGMYYNPAGLGTIKRMEIGTSYGKLYLNLKDRSDLSEGSVGIVYPVRKKDEKSFHIGTFGLSVRYFSLAGLYNENTVGLYYGRKMLKLLYIGGGLKIFNLVYGKDAYTDVNPVFTNTNSKTNIGIDFGLMSHIAKDFVIGFKIENINQPDIGLKYNDPVPIKLGTGLIYKTRSLVAGSDLTFQHGLLVLNAGIEKVFFRYFKLRGGFGIGSKNYRRLNTGFGYESKNIFIDWGMYYPLSGIQATYGTHKLSFGYRFGDVSIEDIKEVENLYEEFKRLVEKGEYTAASSRMNQILDLAPYEPRYQKYLNEINYIARYLPEETQDTKDSSAIRKGIYKYIIEDETDKAIEFLLYAKTIQVEEDRKAKIDKILRFISKYTGEEIPEVPGGWSLVDQKLHLALEYFNNKAYAECIKLCEEVLELEKDNITALKRLGSAYYMLGDLEKAKEIWKRSIDLAPEDEENKKLQEMLEKM